MVVYILSWNAKSLLGLFCISNCIHLCSHITLRSTVAAISVATSDVSTSDLMFSDKFLMSDVFETNLMLTGLLFLFSTFPILLCQI